MSIFGVPEFFALIVTAFVSAVTALLLWERRNASGGTAVALLMLAVTEWALVAALEASSHALAAKILWSKLEYLGSGSTVTLYLFFSLQRSGFNVRLASRKTLALWLLPIANLAVAFTDGWHHLLWTGFEPSPAPSNQIIYHHGVLFYVLLAAMYVYALVGTFLLFRNTLRGGFIRKRQSQAVLIASLTPLVGGLLYALDPSWLHGLNITPMSFGVTGLVLAVSVIGLRHFDIAPLARDALFEAMDDGVLVLDEACRVVDVNPAVTQLLGLDASCIGMPVEDALSSWPTLSRECLSDRSGFVEFVASEEPLRVIDARRTTLGTRSRSPRGIVLVLRDVTQRVQAQREIEQVNDRLREQVDEISRLQEAVREQAVHDSLTGLFNRRYLEETLPRELATSARRGTPIALILLDVDRFKSINDGLGHHVGDRALQKLAGLLDADTREGDIVCRYGGDEFVLVLPDTSLASAIEKAETLRAACKRMKSSDVPEFTISIGVACAPDHGGEGEQLLLAADRALYQAKRDGRDRVVAANR